MGLVEVAGGEPVRLEDRLAVERPPLAVARAAGHVGDDHVRVQLRLLRPRGAVLVGGGDKALAVLARDAAGAAADDARFVLEVGERGLPGGGVRLVDRPPGLLVAERVQEADALRDGEDEVEAGDRAERLLLPSPLAARRVDLLDRDRSAPSDAGAAGCSPVSGWSPRISVSQLAVLDDAFEPERQRRLCRSRCPGDSPRPGVVVVDPGGDGALVVALLARRQLCDAQHCHRLCT